MARRNQSFLDFVLNRDEMASRLGTGAPTDLPGWDALLAAWQRLFNAERVSGDAHSGADCPGTHASNSCHATVNPNSRIAFDMGRIGVVPLILAAASTQPSLSVF